MKRLGLIVNPIAGIGGRVGLKGSDGTLILEKARALGGEEVSPKRTVEALKQLLLFNKKIEIITYPSEMGEYEAIEAGFNPSVIGKISPGNTTASDTRAAALDMLNLGVDLIIFSGGDGTARDIYEAIDGRIPVIGIPSGVKIHSGVFAITPSAAGSLAAKFLSGELASVHESEVMDIDEDAFRENRLSAKLFGYLKVPHEEALMQTSKEATSTSEEENLKAIAADIIDEMDPDTFYIIGPGSTTRAIAEQIGVQKTLLGVDVVQNCKIILKDANEYQLLQLIEEKKAKIIVTIIGGQGFVFGRGNQQISPSVIKAVGKENILIVATPVKLASLHGRPLLVDTGDPNLDEQLSGYMRIITDYGRRVVYRVKGG